ncbi:cAMP phosphodiesterases class-II-domain-containing protein [Schizophyllum fasciatum]
MVVVGSGGGCDETNLSSYLIKPATAAWTDGIISIEAGSGQGALQQILERNPKLFDRRQRFTAAEIYSHVRCFLISHGHLDHVSSLVLSAGSLKGPRKLLYAARDTLGDLETVFADRIWPNLASWNANDEDFKYLYSALEPSEKRKTIHDGVSVRSFRLNHGSNDSGAYESSAFSIRHDPSGREFLFFGDVEPDSLAKHPRTIDVWRYAAPKVATTLSAIFIECSYPSGRPDALLFGHLNPEHLTAELIVLATEVVKARRDESSAASKERSRPPRKKKRKSPIDREDRLGALKGLRVYITHCKADLDGTHDRPIHEVIAGQVRRLVEREGLGAEIIAAEQGMRIANEDCAEI